MLTEGGSLPDYSACGRRCDSSSSSPGFSLSCQDVCNYQGLHWESAIVSRKRPSVQMGFQQRTPKLKRIAKGSQRRAVMLVIFPTSSQHMWSIATIMWVQPQSTTVECKSRNKYGKRWKQGHSGLLSCHFRYITNLTLVGPYIYRVRSWEHSANPPLLTL